MELELILTELPPFELSHFRQCFCNAGYDFCVINFSDNFQWIYLKLCILVVGIIKMCMCILNGACNSFDRITTFLTFFDFSETFLGFFLHCRVWSLCYQFLLSFSMDLFETKYTRCGHN